jgi:hypothetical protein
MEYSNKKDRKTDRILIALILAILLLLGVVIWLLTMIASQNSDPINNTSDSATAVAASSSSSESPRNQSNDNSKDPENPVSGSSISSASSALRSPNEFIYDHEGLYITNQVRLQGVAAGLISSFNNDEIGFDYPITLDDETKRNLELQFGQVPTRTLDDILPPPVNPPITNRIVWPKYNIDAPIIYSSLTDLFRVENGTINFNSYVNNVPIDSPIQQKLTQGVVHVAYSPLPGEIGNSYIIGHSTNYLSVNSPYNEVFGALERAGEAGEIFTVYDHEGRRLNFRVFEAFEVEESEVDRAYNRFDRTKRIVTLQASILDEFGEPTRRWLIRGELVASPFQVGGGGGGGGG